MRHSRKAVMAERYKLYMKKNVFNGRYLVRNIQIFVCAVLVIALVAGAVVLSCSNKNEDVVTASASAGVKEALFGNSEEEKKVTKNREKEEVATTESTEEIVVAVNTEAALKDSDSSENVEADKETEAAQPEKEQEEKSDFDGKCIANVDETLNIRKEPSAEAEFVGSMNRGAIAKVESTEGEWTKIKSGNVEGYVLSEYILTGKDAEKLAEDYVTLRGTVLEDGVNIRSGESTDSEIVTVLDKDDTITVLEDPEKEDSEEENSSETKDVEDVAQTEEKTSEASAEKASETPVDNTEDSTEMNTSETLTEEGTSEVSTENETSEDVTEQTTVKQNEVQETATEKEDTITWIPVALEDGTTGYVSADFVKVESLYELAISAEELERQALEAEAARKAAEEEAARQAAAEAAKQAAAQTSNSNSGNTSNTTNTSNTNSDSYEGATTKPVTTTESGECIGTFTITAYCGCKKCSGGSQKTASGTTPTEGRTIAADTSILPFGTKVVIGGVVYTVEDRGSGVNGNHIDIFFATHAKALAFGRKSMKVYKY